MICFFGHKWVYSDFKIIIVSNFNDEGEHKENLPMKRTCSVCKRVEEAKLPCRGFGLQYYCTKI